MFGTRQAYVLESDYDLDALAHEQEPRKHALWKWLLWLALIALVIYLIYKATSSPATVDATMPVPGVEQYGQPISVVMDAASQLVAGGKNAIELVRGLPYRFLYNHNNMPVYFGSTPAGGGRNRLPRTPLPFTKPTTVTFDATHPSHFFLQPLDPRIAGTSVRLTN